MDYNLKNYVSVFPKNSSEEVNLTTKFKMVLEDGYESTPPQPKTYIVEIPGSNGSLDLTEALTGGIAYSNRTQNFTFYIFEVDNYEKTKTQIMNFIHGKEFDYKLSMDPEYIYHGRFSITSIERGEYDIGTVMAIKVQVSSDPFKYKSNRIYRVDGIGGGLYIFESGEKRVRPKFQCDSSVYIIHDGKEYILPAGSWAVNDIVFNSGENKLYFKTLDVHNLQWEDLYNENNEAESNITWKQFSTRPLFEWYKYASLTGSDMNSETFAEMTWNDVKEYTWENLTDFVITSSQKIWSNLIKTINLDTTISEVYIEYEWGDL